ncbi:hypothetical protein ES705_07119 [subsurface metagenome]
MALLSWDLVSPLEYTAGQEIDFNLHFEAPANTEAKKFYVLGGLYTDTTYISGSLFGILKAAEVDYGVNSTTYMSVWELDPEESVELPCKFTLNRSNCLLALFLMEMVGDEVDLDNDVEVAQIQVQLTAPVPVEEEIMVSVIPFIGGVMLLGMMAMMMRGMFKG